MPTECITNPLQRELADSIIRMVPLDEIRILLACGAKVIIAFTQSKKGGLFIYLFNVIGERASDAGSHAPALRSLAKIL